MKKFRIIAVLAIAFCFLLGTTAVYGYDHSVTVSAGNGSFDKDPVAGTVATIDTEKGEVDINGKTSTLVEMPDKKAPADSKYFVTGMKITGHDNGEGDDYVFADSVDITDSNAPDSYRDKDTELVVAYGLKSNMVKYTISYLDQNRAELHPSETHYGVIGQKPVVSYKYIQGYLPQAYKLAKRLTNNPADNVFEFTYSPTQAAEGNTIINNTGNANAAAGNAAGNAAAGNAAAGNAAGNAGANAGANAGTTIGDNATPLAIDDQDTPLANPDEEEKDGGSPLMYIIGGVVVAAAIAAAIAAFLARRRAGEEE